jgi:hypothetical protein
MYAIPLLNPQFPREVVRSISNTGIDPAIESTSIGVALLADDGAKDRTNRLSRGYRA